MTADLAHALTLVACAAVVTLAHRVKDFVRSRNAKARQ